MIGNKVKQMIEQEAKRVASENIFLKKAHEGALTQEHITNYLFNLEYLFKYTTINLEIAAGCARARGWFDLADFMIHKKTEEAGHDQWSRNDIENLLALPESTGAEGDAKSKPKQSIKTSLRQLLSYVREIIFEDPRLFLAYMSYVEYVTVLVAPQFLEHLEKECGISRAHMTSVANHEELDKDHAHEDFEVIDRFITDEAVEKRLLNTLQRSIQLVDAFLTDCATA